MGVPSRMNLDFVVLNSEVSTYPMPGNGSVGPKVGRYLRLSEAGACRYYRMRHSV